MIDLLDTDDQSIFAIQSPITTGTT